MNEQTKKGDIYTFIHPSGNACVVIPAEPLFVPGQLVSSAAADETLVFGDVCAGLGRHLCGDWGDVDEALSRANGRGLDRWGLLASAFRDGQGTEFSFLTTADRAFTFLVLRDECREIYEGLFNRLVN